MATPNDIYNEITRIDNAKQGIAEAIEEKGVQVPAGTPIQDFPGKVRQIQTGSPDAVLYTPQDLTPEQQEQARENIGAYKKPETGIPAGDLAEPVQQELAKAGTAYQKPGTGIPKTDLANGVQTSLEKADTALQPAALTPITELIPEQATPQNQLADKNFVNSSVATNTANYISDNGQPFQSVADLEAYTGPLTNNDYAFVVGTDSAGNTTYTRYKYNATTQTWAAEYVLNNSSFTAAQWAAISSGITALLVQKLSDLPTEIVTYVAQTLTDAQKQQARANIGATAPEIFWAEYGVTTAADIDQAIADGKAVFCNFNNRQYPLGLPQSGNYITFGLIYGGLSYYLLLNRTNNFWMQGSNSLENTANRSQSIETDRTSTTKYPSVKAVADALGKLGVVSQKITFSLAADGGYDYTKTNIVWGLIPQANIDLVVAAGAIFNEDTGYFELGASNDIAYDEIMEAYRRKQTTLIVGVYYTDRVSREIFPGAGQSVISVGFRGCDKLRYIPAVKQGSYPHITVYGNDCFYGLCSVEEIQLSVYARRNEVSNANMFYNCFRLKYVKLVSIDKNVTLAQSPLITVQCVYDAVRLSANTTQITITLHATAYARMQADTTEYTYNGQTYTGIIAYAAARNITIASA